MSRIQDQLLFTTVLSWLTMFPCVSTNCPGYDKSATCDRRFPIITSETHQQRHLINSLLEGYDSLMRPYYDANDTTMVTVDLFINSVDSIAVDTMDFSVNIYLRQEWRDPRLAYGHNRSYENISSLTIDSKLFDAIWVPDLFFPNEKRSHAHCVTMPNRLIRIFPDGRVLYSSRYTLTLACDMSLRAYPFDQQECFIKMESYGYTMDEMQFVWRKDEELQIDSDTELPQFRLDSWNATDECLTSYITGNFKCLKVILKLQREYGYFLIQNYVPSVLVVVLSWVSFWINIDAVPARISLGVMTVLTITTQSVGVWMSLPRVSYVKAIDVWMSTGVFFVFAAMLEFAIVNTLSRKEIRRMSIKAREVHKDVSSDLIKRMMDEYTYGTFESTKGRRMLARRVDKYSRLLFPLTYLIFNIIYWCYFLINR